MQFIIDHITSVLISAVVLLAGLTMLGVANRAGVRIALSQGATGNHLWLTEVLDQDLVNLGARPFDPYKAVESYVDDPDDGHLQFAAPIEPDGGVNHVRWTWKRVGAVEIDSAGTRITVPRYDVARYVGDGTSFSTSSQGWAARFSLRLLDANGIPVTADSLTRRVQVQVMTLARQWGDDPPYRVQNDYRATYYPVNLHK
jgi:hypothetical protein